MRQRRQIDRNKWMITTATQIMERTRHQFLAGTTIATNQHRQVRIDHAGHRLKHVLHGTRPANDRAALFNFCMRSRCRRIVIRL